jgi:putative ABC transport system permease protein
MKYLPLVLTNLFRKKTRTALTAGSFAVALFLFGILTVVDSAFQQGVDVAGVDRLVVLNRVSIIQPLPLSYRDRLARIPGVTQVTFANWFGGVYQDERNFFPQFAIDRETYRQMFPEFVLPDAEWQAFLGDREGAVVGESLAERFKWKVGDASRSGAPSFRGPGSSTSAASIGAGGCRTTPRSSGSAGTTSTSARRS